MRRYFGLYSTAFVAALVAAFMALTPLAHANPAREQLFQTRVQRSDLETLTALKALVPLDHYRISKAEVLAIAKQLELSIAETHFELARLAATRKQTPLSNFGVGAAGVTTAGEVFLGANIEFPGAGLGATLHAERTVLLLVNDARAKLEKLYSTVTPCGGCRQWLNEIEGGRELQIVSKDQNGAFFSKTLGELLPNDFGPYALGQKGLLDAKQFRGDMGEWTIPGKVTAGLGATEVLHLVQAVEGSYAPYTQNMAGVLIRLKDGSHVTGSYTEQAAFESYSALHVAIAKLKMAQVQADQISAVYMMLSPPTRAQLPVDHAHAAELILKTLSDHRGDKKSDKKFDAGTIEIPFSVIQLNAHSPYPPRK